MAAKHRKLVNRGKLRFPLCSSQLRFGWRVSWCCCCYLLPCALQLTVASQFLPHPAAAEFASNSSDGSAHDVSKFFFLPLGSSSLPRECSLYQQSPYFWIGIYAVDQWYQILYCTQNHHVFRGSCPHWVTQNSFNWASFCALLGINK